MDIIYSFFHLQHMHNVTCVLCWIFFFLGKSLIDTCTCISKILFNWAWNCLYSEHLHVRVCVYTCILHHVIVMWLLCDCLNVGIWIKQGALWTTGEIRGSDGDCGETGEREGGDEWKTLHHFTETESWAQTTSWETQSRTTPGRTGAQGNRVLLAIDYWSILEYVTRLLGYTIIVVDYWSILLDYWSIL